MQVCEYVFPIAFPLYVAKNVVFEGEDVKILCSNPKRHYPVGLSRVKIGSTA